MTSIWRRIFSSGLGTRPAFDLRTGFLRAPAIEPAEVVVSHPLYLSSVMRYYIQPAALRAGITKKLSWHTFRHTFSTLLKANGEDVKVIQELLRHASTRDHVGRLYAGGNSGEAPGPAQGHCHDSARKAEKLCTRECTQNFRAKSGKCLKEFGVPDGI